MAPVDAALALSGDKGSREIEEWSNEVEEVTSQIRGIIDGTITDFEDFDQKLALKERAKQIRQEEQQARRQKVLLYGSEGKGEGTKYKWWCKRCFVEYFIDLPEGKCSRCQQSDQMMSQEARRAELMEKLDVFKEEKAKHKWRKDKWNRWKKSQALLGKSRFINYKAWEYWEPDTDSEEEGDPIVPRDNPEFLAMEADLKDRKKKQFDKAKTAEKCRQRGNQCMTEGDYVGAIEHYDEGLEYRRDSKALWTNKALAELKVFRWHDAIASCNKVIEYSEIFEDGFKKSEDANFKAFTRRAQALRGLHRWEDALNDLEDALSIYPRNKEALDLMEKTKQACEDAKKAHGVEAAAAEVPACGDDAEAAEAAEGVRVEIEESDEETTEAAPVVAVEASGEPLHSLERLNKKEFSQLLKDLDNATFRSAFCARSTAGTASGAKADQWVGRKIDLKVDEVVQPSRLDSALHHMERCCVLWRKRRRTEGVMQMQDDEPEAKDADDFVELVTPRALSVLLALAKQNDHHCSLTVPAVRHVWPLLEGSQQWRYEILSLLFEWSQRSISAKAMAEFAARYPQHLQMLIDIVAKEKKEDALPPGFQDNAKKAADFLELGSEAAMQQMMDSLLVQSPMELAIGSVGNLCAAGASLNLFQEQISGLVPAMVSALRRHLRPNDWRVCGPAAGALCNLLRLPSAAAEVESCSELLLKALSEETKPEIAAMKELKAQLPSRLVVSATSRLLGVLVNLVVCRPTSLAQLQHHGALEIVLPLLDPEAYSSQGSDDEPQVISTRVCLLSGRLIGAFPDALKLDQEMQLLQKLQKILQTISEFISKVAGKTSIDEKILELFDPPVRLLVTLLTKTGALTRLARRSEENSEPSRSLSSVVLHLSQLLKALLPAQHLVKEEEGASASRLRGNLALLFGQLSEMQAANEDAAVWKALDLGDVVETFLEMFRRERGAAQHNLGVCITKFCSNGRYRERVKEGNGLESLHQIQLPKVNDQKEKEQRMHRLETSVTDRRREILRRR